jgi:acetyltransferase-like isoleucine patch superfamily enzyme
MIEANPNGLRVASDVKHGAGVRLFGFVNLYGCEIGDETKIGCFVEIQKGAKVGARCKISSHTFICEGVTIEDGVFVGHGVMFSNDRWPRAVGEDAEILATFGWECQPTLVKKGASIGSGATILGGLVIGENAMVGAGSVVTRDVPAGTTVVGNPARPIKPRNPKNP